MCKEYRNREYKTKRSKGYTFWKWYNLPNLLYFSLCVILSKCGRDLVFVVYLSEQLKIVYRGGDARETILSAFLL